ncbi:protein LURP-one-related 6-like [Telopea speciosissima]|uniref:protein LURP-one-related 6-like n=1 Tax=Telopea speciosissima TaxID=54955 RepID=UPI001CC60251|nr:protein LURP-one-related 6-like [Telopea speciosissima]
MTANAIIRPIVSKLYCSASQVVLTVRRRPHVVNGGGFVVTDCSQKIIFRVDDCGTLGTKGELILRDGEGEPVLLIRRKEGMFQALGINRQWKGYMVDYEGPEKLVFILKEPHSYLAKNNSIRVNVGSKRFNMKKDWDFEVRGSFPDKACAIIDSAGNTVAQVGVRKETQLMMVSKDLYQVVVQQGFDQAFVFGVIAVLDNIYEESSHY